MEKNKQNINPAVIGGIAAGAAVVGAAGTAAAQEFAEQHPDFIQSIMNNAPELPDEINEQTPEAVIVEDDNDTTTANHQMQQSYTDDEDEQHVGVLEDDLVAVEAVDPGDSVTEASGEVEYGGVGVIVSDEGVDQNYTVVEMGNDQFTMVDIDGDGVFDVMQDDTGRTLNISNNPEISAVNVSDVEVQIQEQNGDLGYMAQTEYDNNSDISASGDYYGNDVVEV